MRTLITCSRINYINYVLQNRCYVCIQWIHVLYSVVIIVITWQSDPPISQFNSLCNEFSVWSLFVYNTLPLFSYIAFKHWHIFFIGIEVTDMIFFFPQLAVLGACRCRISTPDPCGCALAAANLKKLVQDMKLQVHEIHFLHFAWKITLVGPHFLRRFWQFFKYLPFESLVVCMNNI